MNQSVGYTCDGMVFMHIPHQGKQGEALRTTIQWKPEMAKEMGECLVAAAEAAIAVKNRGNGDDSATVDRGST